jgi:uncharacterized protein YdeI (YjbR/CyaY-like superfamily)
LSAAKKKKDERDEILRNIRLWGKKVIEHKMGCKALNLSNSNYDNRIENVEEAKKEHETKEHNEAQLQLLPKSLKDLFQDKENLKLLFQRLSTYNQQTINSLLEST